MRNFLIVLSCLFFALGSAQTASETANPFAVEKVPVYPGCELGNNNETLKKCMMSKIYEHISQNFDISISGTMGLKGRQRIGVKFTIDKKGYITDLQIEGPHTRLIDEARKVMMTLPRMVPGEQRGEPVDIMYALPIVFDIEG